METIVKSAILTCLFNLAVLDRVLRDEIGTSLKSLPDDIRDQMVFELASVSIMCGAFLGACLVAAEGTTAALLQLL